MAKDLVDSIRELNRRNRERLTGQTDARPGENNSDVLWLQEFEKSVCREIRRRADNVVGRFSDRLHALEREARRPDPRLEATQEIEYVEAGDPTHASTPTLNTAGHDESVGHQELVQLLTQLTERVDSLQTNLMIQAASDGADSVDEGRELEELRDSTSQTLKQELAEFSRVLDEKLATIGTGTTTPSAEVPASVEASLASIQETLNQWPTTTGDSNGGGTDSAEISTRIAELEQSLEEKITNLFLQANASGGETSASAGDSGGGLPEDAAEQLQGLRGDFSLLVHTINNHLEENAQFAEEITRLREELQGGGGPTLSATTGDSTSTSGPDMREAMTQAITEVMESHAQAHREHLEQSLEKFVGEITWAVNSNTPDTESMQRLEGILEGLDPVRALPDKIGSLLEAADESQQASLNAAIQDAIDVIVNRLEEMFQRLS